MSPVAVPGLTAHTQCARPHTLDHTWLCPCAEYYVLPRVVHADLACLWPLLLTFIFFSTFPFSLSSMAVIMTDGPSSRCAILTANYHNPPSCTGQRSRSPLGAGPRCHYHQVNVPGPRGKVHWFSRIAVGSSLLCTYTYMFVYMNTPGLHSTHVQYIYHSY